MKPILNQHSSLFMWFVCFFCVYVGFLAVFTNKNNVYLSFYLVFTINWIIHLFLLSLTDLLITALHHRQHHWAKFAALPSKKKIPVGMEWTFIRRISLGAVLERNQILNRSSLHRLRSLNSIVLIVLARQFDHFGQHQWCCESESEQRNRSQFGVFYKSSIGSNRILLVSYIGWWISLTVISTGAMLFFTSSPMDSWGSKKEGKRSL